MVNSYMHVLSFHKDKPTSPLWKPCLPFVTTVLSSHIPAPKDFTQTWPGGLQPYKNLSLPDQSHNRFPFYDVGAFSDASSGIGIAIIIGRYWRAWRLIPGWQTLDGQRDISWAEAIGFECLVRCLSDINQGSRHFLIYGDNKGVVEGWWNGRSHNSEVNNVFKRIHDLSPDDNSGHSFHTVYVQSKSNPADKPSRGVYPSTKLLLPPIQLPASLKRFLVDSQEQYTPTEQRLCREGRYPKAIAKSINDANNRDQASLQFGFDHIDQSLPRSHFIWDDKSYIKKQCATPKSTRTYHINPTSESCRPYTSSFPPTAALPCT